MNRPTGRGKTIIITEADGGYVIMMEGDGYLGIGTTIDEIEEKMRDLLGVERKVAMVN